jgi:hypothetical protein
MDVIVPRPVTLTASNVAIDEALWNVGTTYATGDRVYLDTVSPPAVYQSLTDNNTGNDPAVSTSDWVQVGAINRYKMLDDRVSSQTERTDSITVTLSASKCDRICLLNLVGESLQVTVRSGSTVISDELISLRLDNQSSSWSEYFFDEIEYRSRVIRPIPGYYANLEVDITITAASGTLAKCGHVILGRSRPLGLAEWGAKAGIADYSRKDTNEFGETYLLQRPYANTLDLDLWIDTDPQGLETDRVHQLLSSLRATPCIYNGNNAQTDRESLIVFGFYRDFNVVVSYATVTHCSIQIEGMI